MPWFKVDDGFHNHPKILAVGNAAAGLFVRCGSYCSQQTTDGFVPETVAKMYGKRAELAALLEQKLLEKVENGYRIPDFLDFNPSAADVAEKRRRTAERVSDWRARKKGGNADVTPLQKRFVTQGVTGAPSRPDPTPIVNGCTESSSVVHMHPSRRPDDDDLEAVLAIITNARIEGRTGVRNPRAYRNTVLTEARAQDGELARSLLADGSPLEQVALFILGHGLGAEEEHIRTPDAWCTTDCERCGGDQWIWLGEDDRPHPCPNGPRAKAST